VKRSAFAGRQQRCCDVVMHIAKPHVGSRACSRPGARRTCQFAAYRGPGFGHTLCLMQYMHKAGSPRHQHAQATMHEVLQYHLTCRVRARATYRCVVWLQCGQPWGGYLSTRCAQKQHGPHQMRHVYLTPIRMWCTPARLGEAGSPSGHGCIRLSGASAAMM
jgi:hypothetical protein